MRRLHELVQLPDVDEDGVIWELAFLVGQVETLLSQGSEQDLAEAPVTVDGLQFLAVVKALGEDATQSEIARWMLRRAPSVSTMTRRLGRKGLVQSRKVLRPNDRIYTVVELTDSGTRTLAELEAASRFLPTVLSGLGLEERAQLRELLFKVRRLALREIRTYQEPPYPSPARPLVVRAD